MNSQKKVKPFNPFDGEIFDDKSVMELNQELINGNITLEEYNQRIKELWSIWTIPNINYLINVALILYVWKACFL